MCFAAFFPSDSARSFMKKHRVGHFNEEEMAKKKAEQAARQEEQKAAADAISVGSRCKVQVPGQPTKLGTVMYVGEWLKLSWHTFFRTLV